MKRTKEVFIANYNNGILIENAPYNMRQDKLVLFASEVLESQTGDGRMSNLTYIANPVVLEDRFIDSDLAKNEKIVSLTRVDYTVDYNTKEVRVKEIEEEYYNEEHEEDYNEEELEAEWQRQQEEYLAEMKKREKEFIQLVGEAREELLGKEIKFFDLDDKMINLGFGSIKKHSEDVKEMYSAIYTNKDGEIRIDFYINKSTENEENFTLEVKRVSVF